MLNRRDIPWSQIAVEGLAIVLSILLAFWIDAWWDQRQTLSEERELLIGLESEFTDLRERLEYWSGINREAIELIEQYLGDEVNAMRQGEVERMFTYASLSNVLDQGGPLEGLIASGRLEMIGDLEIRQRLAKWPDWLEDIHTNDLSIREYAMREIMPLLANKGIPHRLCEGAELACGPDEPLSQEMLTLAQDRELRAHLINRRLLAAITATDMENASKEAADIIALMQERTQVLP